MRSGQYRYEAIKFREMAEAETDYKLRRQFLELAERYEELAVSTPH
jgi:hypothetical protein